MAIPTPEELIKTYGRGNPETLAHALGFQVQRQEAGPMLPGVTVLSEFKPGGIIILYRQAVRQTATQREEAPEHLEQWLIAHEMYHGLSVEQAISSWRARETDADLWADELCVLALPSSRGIRKVR